MARREPPKNVEPLIEDEEFQRKMQNLAFLAAQPKDKPKP